MSEHGDPEFSRAFIAAYEQMPLWWQDQFRAHVRDAGAYLVRICNALKRLGLIETDG